MNRVFSINLTRVSGDFTKNWQQGAWLFLNLRPNASPDLDGLKSKNVQLFQGYPTV
jgi:hypothetical protein